MYCPHRKENSKNLVNKLKNKGFSASFVSCDVSDGKAFSDAISNIYSKNKRFDILINNAGITRDALLMRMNDEQWDSVMNTNLKGAFHGMKAAMRPMMKNKSV